MLQVRRCADFGKESVGTDYCGELRLHDLQCDGPIVSEVVREIHGRHSTSADLAIHAVAISQ
jgi:hypothetical protein